MNTIKNIQFIEKISQSQNEVNLDPYSEIGVGKQKVQ